MALRDLALIDKRRHGTIANDLERFCIQIVELYLSFIYGRVDTGKVIKVVIQLTPIDQIEEPCTVADTVLFLDWPFDFDTLAGVDDTVRKRIILDQIHRALMWTATKQGWDSKEFDNAYIKSLESGVTYKGEILKKWLLHPSLPILANCEFEFDSEKVHVSIILRRTDGTQIGRKYAYWTPVREDLVRKLLDRIEWVGKDRSQIKTVPGRGSWGEQSEIVDLGDIIHGL